MTSYRAFVASAVLAEDLQKRDGWKETSYVFHVEIASRTMKKPRVGVNNVQLWTKLHDSIRCLDGSSARDDLKFFDRNVALFFF